MEVDGGSESGGGVSGEVEKKNTPEGEPKVKRKMKTPSQLEILEKTYAVETYPSEALRAELSVKLGLSDRQLQMWFCHRRLKDRKAPTEKRQRKTASPTSGGCADEMVVNNADMAKEHTSGLCPFGNMDLLLQQQQRVVHKVGTAVPRILAELPSMRRFYEPPLAVSEQRAIAFVEAQLGEPLREDGPILGMEFDPLPPGAFGAPIVGSGLQKPAKRSYDVQLNERLDAKPFKGSSRALHEYQFLPEKPSARNDAYERALPPQYYGSPTDIRNARVPLPIGKSIINTNEQVPSGYGFQGQMPSFSVLPQQGRQGHHQSPASGEVDIAPRIAPLVDVNIDAHYLVHPKNGLDNQIITPDRLHDEMRLERKRKTEEARIAKEVEAHDKRIQKELEKQNILRRKREEQMRKDMERKDRERRKEEERLLREKQREEERYLREQRREMERREKFLQKEYTRAEKMRLKEEMRREKEAVRLKAANSRAAARRIAKESMDLIEDECLELMELAASSRGLPSILALDGGTLQNLDLFKDIRPEFPPKSVHLKKPFGVQSWTDSEENVGNFLMVWRFLITFADVLDLWPFTLDEFAQAFYDCDPRLLGEIHIALLRSIIKDIEDVARTPATALVANQNSAVTPGGGHPQIVEGAYAWGFDLLSWQRHLSPITWPEVLRQFALSAGFGPKLKKQNVEPANVHNENEVDDGAEIISNLRSGLAAENAVAVMQERGFSNPRRSRHRLTPGTVKFAAFHILSLVGSKGLSILEVADKIQKSGLRDLTTSKTPEASISAALSRDTKLFERTAPSTYCVRSPYRKDPADAEAILSEAREKIWVFQNGNAYGDEAEDVEKEDAERDQDSESDVADDPNADTELKLKEASHSSETSTFKDKNFHQYGKENCCELMDTPLAALGNAKGSSTLIHSVGEIKSNGASRDLLDVTGIHSHTTISDQENTVIDECESVEPWVQGLTEGEYADLSIEERLNALVALIGVANEGNAIRLALEERLEAAKALKKQMWAEAQLDKRRMKEEHILKLQHSFFAVNRADQIFSHCAVEDMRSPQLSVDIKNEVPSTNPAFQLMDLNDQQNEQNSCNETLTQEFSVGSDTLLLQQSVYAAEKSRSELKAFIGHRAEEMYVYRSLPLGLDRRLNRYWQFITSLSPNDPCSGRIFVELCSGVWRLIDSEEDFDSLLSSLDVRGIRECHLHLMLLKIEASFKATARSNLSCTNSVKHVCDEVEKEVPDMRRKLNCISSSDSSKSLACASDSNSPENLVPFAIEPGNNGKKENDIMERYNDFEKWMWEECFNFEQLVALKYGRLRCQQLLDICKHCHALFCCDDDHCPSCHRTFSNSERTFNFREHITECKRKLSENFDRVLLKLALPPRIRFLKAQLATIEASIPPEALKSVWSDEYRKSWGMKLHLSSSAAELLQTLTLLEDNIERDFLSATYEVTCELLSSSNHIGHPADSFSRPEAVVLPWIPQTTPAVALRLMELDSSIYYTLHQKEACQKDNGAGYFIKLPSRMGSSIDNVSQARYLQQDNWLDLGSRHTSLKRGRGRPRGPSRTCGKSQRRANNFRDEFCHGTTTKCDKFGQLPGWKGRPRGRGGRKKCRRSVKSRQNSAKRTAENVDEKRGANDIVYDTPDLRQEEWDLEETPIEVVGAANVSTSERSEFDDDNGQVSADEYNHLLVGDFSGVGKSGDFSGSVDYGVDIEDDQRVEVGNGDDVNYDDDDEGDDGEDEPGDYYVDEYFNSEYHEEGNQLTGGEQVRNMDKSSDIGSVSTSSDYSY